MMTILEKTMWKKLGEKVLVSIGIFASIFLILYIIEWTCPNIRGALLRWNEMAFIVGIPASIIGVAYVMTIQDPKNYTGFAGGIGMALLLAIQFYLQGNIDLVVLQLGLFVPFMAKSYIRWRQHTLALQTQATTFIPEWLPWRQQLLSISIMIALIAADYALLTLVIECNAWHDNILLKLISGLMIASSILANFILIYQKIDAWIWWLLYSISGMLFYALIGNAFSFVLFTICLVVNANAGLSWLKLRKEHKK